MSPSYGLIVFLSFAYGIVSATPDRDNSRYAIRMEKLRKIILVAGSDLLGSRIRIDLCGRFRVKHAEGGALSSLSNRHYCRLKCIEFRGAATDI